MISKGSAVSLIKRVSKGTICLVDCRKHKIVIRWIITNLIDNVWFVGDRQTCSHEGHPPMAPRVTQCAAMMAEVALDLALGLIKVNGE